MKIQPLAYATLVIISCTACAGNTSLPGGVNSLDAKAAAGTTSLHAAQNATLCLTVGGDAIENGSPVQLSACNEEQSQAWTLSSGQAQVFGNRCLDVKNGQTITGETLQIWDCDANDPNQQWTYQNNMLQWAGHTTCVDLPAGADKDNDSVLMWTCNAQDNGQLWYLQQNSGEAGAGGSGGGSATGGTGTTGGGSGTTTGTGGGGSDGNTVGSGKYTKLVWADEFDGAALNANNWNIEVNCDGGGNNEAECYTSSPSNLQLDGQGHLLINAKEQSGLAQGRQFSSGRIDSMGKADFRYGRYEARVQVPTGQGFWPAFWLMPQTSVYGVWPTSGELDIMEILGSDPTTLYGTAHYGAATPYTESQGKSSGTNFSQGYHVFAIERDATQLRWYMDDQLYFTLDSTDAAFWPTGYTPADGTPWPFQQDFFFILNLAVGGQWPGAPDPSLTAGSMAVDYVHFYQ